jgi:hypothetical protein
MITDVPSKASSISSGPAEWKCPEHSQVTKVKGLSSVSIQPTAGNRPCRQPHRKGCTAIRQSGLWFPFRGSEQI